MEGDGGGFEGNRPLCLAQYAREEGLVGRRPPPSCFSVTEEGWSGFEGHSPLPLSRILSDGSSAWKFGHKTTKKPRLRPDQTDLGPQIPRTAKDRNCSLGL